MVNFFWKVIGNISTAIWLLGIFGLTSVTAAGIYFASATKIVRIFAPLSYFIVTIVSIMISLLIIKISFDIYVRMTGWKPMKKAPRLLRQIAYDAPLLEVVNYLQTVAAFADTLPADDGARTLILDKEIMDRVSEKGLSIWGRSHHAPVRDISRDWWASRVDASTGTVRRGATNIGVQPVLYYDVVMNWQQVRSTWPKRALWRRIARRHEAIGGRARKKSSTHSEL